MGMIFLAHPLTRMELGWAFLCWLLDSIGCMRSARFLITLTGLLGAFGGAPVMAQGVVETVLGDGRVVHAETVAGADGAAVRHGKFKVAHSDGETNLVSGEYLDGVREGRWVYRYGSGDKLASGNYRDGVRKGRWKFYWQSGALASEGTYKEGEAGGQWLFYGLLDSAALGPKVKIERVVGTSPLDGCSYSGYLGNGAAIGWWKIVRPDGSTLFEGAYERGGGLRSYSYRHAGDVVDPVFFDERKDARHPDDYAFQQSDEYGGLRIGGDFPALEVEPGLASGVAFVGADPALSGIDPMTLKPLKVGTKVLVYPPGYRVRDLELRECDAVRIEVASALKTACTIAWDDLKGKTSALGLFQDVIEPGLGYPQLGIDFRTKKANPERSHLALLRAHSMLSIYRADKSFWTIDAQLATTSPTDPQTVLTTLRINPTLWLDKKDRRVLAAQQKSAGAVPAKRHGNESVAAIGKGLDWLLSEQLEDGSWPAGTSSVPEDAVDERHKESLGQDVGVTALAVLALVRDPLTPSMDERMDAIRRGCAFILSSRVRGPGYFATMFEAVSKKGETYRTTSSQWIYAHAVSLQALAEARSLVATPRLDIGIKDAAAVLMRAKNPYGCWRYAIPANGDSDTSVTFWVTRALLTAETAGVPLVEGATNHVLQFMGEMTDEGSGRVGYVERGTPSARVPGVNLELFPPGAAETLTAEAVALRCWLGEKSAEITNKGADLLLRTLPSWEPENYTVDYGYWIAGTEALSQIGGKHLKVWRKATLRVAIGSQVSSGEGEGSWPPVGVWCAIGGRVYATATAVMTLQHLQ